MTQEDTHVTINFGEPTGTRILPFPEVRRVIHDCLNTSNFALASTISTQLADQLRHDLWSQLVAAESLSLHQHIEPAFQYIDRALEIDPHNIACLVAKSRLCVHAGDQRQAIELINSAIGLAPEDSRLHSVKAEIFEDTGSIEDARNSFTRSIELDPRNTSGLLGLSRLPGDNFSDELIKKIEFIIQSKQLSAEDQIICHFALAQAYDKKADIAHHFDHLSAGNALKSNSLKYDPSTSTLEAQSIINNFSAEFFSQRTHKTGNSANIIFIVGFPRCGSTLVEQILSSHPSVSAAGEVFALRHAIQDFQKSKTLTSNYPFWIAEQPVNALGEIADNYLHKVKQFHQHPYLTDKLLDNYKYAGLIHLIFPDATIINVVRNPIDVCYSCYKHLFNLGSLPYAYNLDYLASKYRDYRQVISHWENVLPGMIYSINYEDLVKNQEEATRALLEQCRLPWDDACLRFQENVRAVQTNSNIQVRQPLYTDSIDRWKCYEKYLGPLLELSNKKIPAPDD